MDKNFIKFVTMTVLFAVTAILSVQSIAAQTASAPEPITNLIAVPRDGEVHLSWTAPPNNGAIITSYKIVRWETGSDIFTTFEGDNTVLMQLVAKGLLTEFKQTFHNDGYRAVLRFLLTKVKHEGYENNPLFKRNTDSAHILDSNFHFHAFNYRQRKILISLSDRMRKYLKRGMDPYQAFLKVQNHMIDLADAYIDQVTLKSFHDRVDRCDNEPVKKILESLVKLYALETIQENKGWFLESDYMDGAKTKSIRRVINKLYQEIHPHALDLVDAFNIPKEMIGAPIAFQ